MPKTPGNMLTRTSPVPSDSLDALTTFEERPDKIAAIRIVVDGENSDGESQRVNVTCVTPLGEEVASTL